jgi:Glycosyl transferase family 90
LISVYLSGVLFHHETATQDFFYRIMKPWVHYIPIRWDLSDLRGKYDWAEANPKEAERISRSGTMLYQRILSGAYMEEVYLELFVEYLSKVVEAYETSNETWEELFVRYNRTLDVIPVGICDSTFCIVEDKDGVPLEPARWTNP